MSKKRNFRPQGEEDFKQESCQEQECCAQQEESQAQSCQGETKAPQQEDKAALYLEQLVRLQADFENYRKRTEKEKPQLINYGKFETLKKLLPLYDTLLKAETASNKPEANLQHIKQGLKMIFEQFDKFFKAENVKIISAKGKPYDPMTQEVITTLPCPPEKDGIVLQELASGVEIDGKTVRPAQVIVGKCSEEQK